jgi:hypothetical protein
LGLTIDRQILYLLEPLSEPFWGLAFMPNLASSTILLLTLPVAGMTGMCHLAQLLLVEMESHKLFAWAGLELRSS